MIPGKVSFTTDMWSDPQGTPYTAVTGHWIAFEDPKASSGKLKLRSALLGFSALPGHHTGAHLAAAFLKIIERVGLVKKVRHLVHCYCAC